jgi:endo-1,4-beta-xylanase
MKNLLLLIEILVFIPVFGIIGCDNSPNNNNPNDSPDNNQGKEEKPSYDITEPDDSILPNLLKMNDGTVITKAEDWPARRNEIMMIMQENSYGWWHSGEKVTYSVSGNTLTINVSLGEKKAEFDATVELPITGTPRAGGWPVILAFGALDGADGFMGSEGNPRQYALDKGYANISVPTNTVASDDNAHTGAFYTLYPYNNSALSQTGVLMAWAWGASKVLDALEAGAAEEFNINANNAIITGTSRNGKAAAVAGAFEERFKITVPVSSGAGGAAMYRYKSAGQTYDLSGYFSYNEGGSWTVDGNNPQSLGSIQSDSGGGWFNAKFRTFSRPEDLPFDQHFLFALCADTRRFLFMINGFEWDKWTNPPGFFYAFERTMPVYNLLRVPQNIAVSMHRFRHGIEQEDMVKLVKYANFVFYGIKDLTFEYAEKDKPKPATWQAFMEELHTTPFSKSVSPANNATYEEGKPK